MQNATRVLLKKKNSQLKKVIYDPVDVRISVSNTNVRSDGGGGGEVSRAPGPSPGSAAVLYECPAPPWGICRFSKTK